MFDVGEGFVILVPWDTPGDGVTGTNWEGVGVQPDLEVESESSLARAQIAALQEILRIGLPAAEKRDARWALEALTSDRTVDETLLQAFAGSYGNRVVRVEGGELSIQRSRWPDRRLRLLDHEMFVVDGSPGRRLASPRLSGCSGDRAGRTDVQRRRNTLATTEPVAALVRAQVLMIMGPETKMDVGPVQI
jgi:hypothetical protein